MKHVNLVLREMIRILLAILGSLLFFAIAGVLAVGLSYLLRTQ